MDTNMMKHFEVLFLQDQVCIREIKDSPKVGGVFGECELKRELLYTILYQSLYIIKPPSPSLYIESMMSYLFDCCVSLLLLCLFAILSYDARLGSLVID